MRIFLSYSSPDRPVAEPIALALQARGHDVFFDREDLEGGEDFDAVILSRIRSANLVIFLISPQSVREGAYTHTELRFAREKWNHPGKHVLPVIIAPTPLEQVPAYLKSVNLFQPEGNVAAEVAAHVSRMKASLWPRYVTGGAAALAALAIIAFIVLRPEPEPGFTQQIEARDFVSRYIYPDDAVERTEYTLDPDFEITGEPDSLLGVTRIVYGSISDTAAAMSIMIRFKNVTPAPLNLDFNHRFFKLYDDQRREGELLYFCCESDAELLAPDDELVMQLIFAGHRDWTGKEVRAHRIVFHIQGLLPLVSGTWSVPALATAADPP